MEYTTIVAAPASDSRRLQVPGAVHRLGDRPALDAPGQARPDHLRRPEQAGRGLPRGVAAAAPPAGPRGVPRRRLLPALPAAGALREAVRRARRRFDDRPADHRDQGQRRLGLHPDQRHLDHRRAVLPGVRPVQLRRAPGHQRRHLGLPRGRLRPAQGHAQGRRPPAPRPGPVPRARGVRGLRLGPGLGVQGPAGARHAAWSRSSSSRSTGRQHGARGRLGVGRARPGSSTRCRSRTSAASTPSSSSYLGREELGDHARHPDDRRAVRRHDRRARAPPWYAFKKQFRPARATCWSRTCRRWPRSTKPSIEHAQITRKVRKG